MLAPEELDRGTHHEERRTFYFEIFRSGKNGAGTLTRTADLHDVNVAL